LVSAREAGLQRVYTVLTRDLSLVQREEIDSLLVAASPDAESTARSRLEQFKAVGGKNLQNLFWRYSINSVTFVRWA
jgi:hypothetical protein